MLASSRGFCFLAAFWGFLLAASLRLLSVAYLAAMMPAYCYLLLAATPEVAYAHDL
jgi:hypothetical protein